MPPVHKSAGNYSDIKSGFLAFYAMDDTMAQNARVAACLEMRPVSAVHQYLPIFRFLTGKPTVGNIVGRLAELMDTLFNNSIGGLP